jgi:NAD(P)-dependent dehydrogenase (short-subunit alcohol dehydrogenase family)
VSFDTVSDMSNGTPLDDRTVVITGAGSGIGRALAQRLAAHGCPVAIADQDPVGLDETAASIAGPVLQRRLDVRDRQGFMTLAAEVADWSPAPIGAVINNAGVSTAQSILHAAPEDDEWVLDINFGGVVNGTRAFLPLLVEQDSGAIVNVSSVFGLLGFPHQSAYCASKFAVRGFTEALRHELRETGVRAITVHPGGVRTNIARNSRFHETADGMTDKDEAVGRFTRVARTSPERAAKIIHRGIEEGRARIRVGPDAVALDVLSRAAPTRYYDVLNALQRFEPR